MTVCSFSAHVSSRVFSVHVSRMRCSLLLQCLSSDVFHVFVDSYISVVFIVLAKSFSHSVVQNASVQAHEKGSCRAHICVQTPSAEVDQGGEKLSALGKELNIPPMTLCTWKKKKQHIQENATLSTVQTPHGRRKRSRGSKSPELEHALLIWFCDMRSQTPPVKIDHKMVMVHADL